MTSFTSLEDTIIQIGLAILLLIPMWVYIGNNIDKLYPDYISMLFWIFASFVAFRAATSIYDDFLRPFLESGED